MRKAVVLLSGGLDSTTVLAHAKSEGFEPYALSFRYGQRHVIELEAAKRVAEAQGVAGHVVCDIDLRVFGGSALTADRRRAEARDRRRRSRRASPSPTSQLATRSSCRSRSPTPK